MPSGKDNVVPIPAAPSGDWFEANGVQGVLDVVAMFDSVDALSGLFSMVEAGALVSIGCTSDKGALGVTITVDGRWRREYFRNAEELAAWLTEAEPHVRQACQTASSARQKRPRSTRGL